MCFFPKYRELAIYTFCLSLGLNRPQSTIIMSVNSSTQQDSPHGRLQTCDHNSSVDDVVKASVEAYHISECVFWSSYRVLKESEFLYSSYLKFPIEVNGWLVLCSDTGSTYAGLTTCSTSKSWIWLCRDFFKLRSLIREIISEMFLVQYFQGEPLCT